ncbi:MAG: anion transporter [Elusimicrobia bacterium]|nr:anion transporter [Elusimicrobiota bacterium]
MIAVLILFAVFLLISVRQIGSLKLEIWQIMSGGAVLALLGGSISFSDALKAVDYDVIIFLFGMFVCGALFEISGYLSYNQHRIFKKADTCEKMLFLFIFFFGLSSALVMNDTVAVIGVPASVSLSKKYNFPLKILLLALAFSVTIGSVFSPIGNPQNLLIAIKSAMSNPFIVFLKYLFIPTILNLFLLFLIFRAVYSRYFSDLPDMGHYIPEKKKWLYFLSNLTMAIILVGISAKIWFSLKGESFRLTWIAVFASMPALLLSFKQGEIIKKTDWKTLIFFAAMFILMKSVWDSGFFQKIIQNNAFDILSLPFIFILCVILSQFISNVPLIALLLPLFTLKGAGENHFIALAAASTLAGNLSILGAASNVIIIQGAENRKEGTISFWEFFKIGAPLTALNCFIYWLFLR